MYKHYLKLIVRYFLKNPGYSLINLLGLSLGIAAAWVIFLYIQYEFSYDTFHPKVDRLYRVSSMMNLAGADIPGPNSSMYLSPFLNEKVSEVNWATTFRPITVKLQRENSSADAIYEQDFAFVDSTFFDVFNFPLLKGDAKHSLTHLNTVILTESLAQKCFPDKNPMNQTLNVTIRDTIVAFTVTGIMKDLPNNTHISIGALTYVENYYQLHPPGYYGWGNLSSTTYASLVNPNPGKDLEEKLIDLLEKEVGEERLWFKPFLQPVSDIHLNRQNSPLRGEVDVKNLYLFGAIALIILLLACINYMNLSTARAVIRVKEIGVRKVLGVKRGQLRGQFLYEALIYSLVAALLALVLVDVSLPWINQYFVIQLDIRAWSKWQNWVFVGSIALVTGFLSGSYPALYLANRGKVSNYFRQQREKGNLRKGLVLVQFAAASILIMGTLAVTAQMRFIKNKDLGFNKDMILYIPLQSDELAQKSSIFRTEFSQLPQIHHISYCGNPLGDPGAAQGFTLPGQEHEQLHPIKFVDTEFAETFELEMVQGRWFDSQLATDTLAYVVNEAFVKHYGFENPIGQSIQKRSPEKTIIGVVKDFHVRSLHKPIEPIVMTIEDNWNPHLALKLAPEDLSGTLAAIQQTWDKLAPSEPLEYQFQDEFLAELYLDEQRFSRLFGGFAGLAIFIACLGLLALVAFTAEARTKEIGIRKVLGASVSDILVLLNKSYFSLILMGFVIALPLAWWLIRQWLENFAYQMPISPGIFVSAGALIGLLTLITVSYFSWKTSRLDPVNSLRYE